MLSCAHQRLARVSQVPARIVLPDNLKIDLRSFHIIAAAD